MKKRISALVLAIAMLLSVMPTAAATEADTFVTTAAPVTGIAPGTAAPAEGAFADTAGTYYEAAAQRWAEVGVLNGVGDNLFAGGNTAKRGEAAKVIVLTAGIKLQDVPADFFAKFTDVPADAWYAPYIYALYLEGIMQGDGISSMRPEDQLTREEYVTLKGRALGVTENKSALRFSSLSGKDEISDWAAGYMGAFIAAGIIKGDENGYINAQGSIVRGEMAVISDRLITDYITEGGTHTVSGTGLAVVATSETVTVKGTFDGTLVVGGVAGKVTADFADLRSLVANGGTVTVKGEADIVTANAGASVTVAEGAEVTAAVANGKNASLTVNGKADSVAVDSSELNVGVHGIIDTVSVSGQGSKVSVVGVVGLIADDKTAVDTTVKAEIGADIGAVNANGTGVEISGWGSVGSVTANGTDVAVSTFGTVVTAGADSVNVTANGGAVTAGSTTALPGSAPTVDRPVITPDPVPAVFTVNPADGSTKFFGKEITLTVAVDEEKDHGYTYQWYMSLTPEYDGVPVSDAKSRTLVIEPTDSSKLGQTFYYYCEATSYLGEKTATSNSEIASVTVKDEALNIFMFGDHILGSYNAHSTFRNMLTEKGVKYNTTIDYCGHTSTSGTWNVYELFASSARDNLNDYTFGTGSTAQTFKAALESKAFDYVILDTGRNISLMWAGDSRYNNYAVRKIAKMAADINPDCQVILIAPYAHTVGLAKDFSAGTKNTHIDTYYEHVAAINIEADQMKADIDADGYLNKPVKLVYASNSFANYSTDLDKITDDLYRPSNNATTSAGYHRGLDTGNRASALGSYLLACLLYEAVTEESPVGVQYLGNGVGALDKADEAETVEDLERLGLTPAEAALMIQQYVSSKYVTYKVEHYLQNADGETYTLGYTDNLLGKADGSVFYAEAKYIDGYQENANHPDGRRVGLLETDGSAVFKVYYDRQYYTVDYAYGNYFNNTNKPNLPETKSYMWGSTVSVEADPVWEGYAFGGWVTYDADVADGTFTMPLGGATFTGKWSKTGVENPVVEIDTTTEVDGFTNETLANGVRFEEETVKGYMEYAADLTGAGFDATEHHAAVLKLSKLIPNAKFELIGLKNGETDVREFTASAEGTAEVLYAFESGETTVTVYVYDEDNELAAELIVGVSAELWADINIYMHSTWMLYSNGLMRTMEAMLEEKLGTSVDIAANGLSWDSTSSSYNSWELFSRSGTTVSGVSNSTLKNTLTGAKPYDYYIMEVNNTYTGMKGDYIKLEDNALLCLQELIAENQPGAELILFAQMGIRQGFSETSYNLRGYEYKQNTDFPYLRSTAWFALNSREKSADVVQCRAQMIRDKLNAADTENKVEVKIANVVDAVEYYILNEGVEDDLYSTAEGKGGRSFSAKRNRPNTNGAYLNAAVLAGTVLGESVLDIETLGSEGYTIAQDTATLLLQIADMFVTGKPAVTAAQLTFDSATGAVEAAEGVGEVTVKFNGAAGVPTRPGTYTVTADVTGGAAYGYAKNIALSQFTVEGDGLGATVALAPNALNAGLTGGDAIAAGETMTLDGTLRYNGKQNSHTVELIATGPEGATVIGQSEAGVGFATVGEDGTAIISVPVTPDKDTIKVTVSNETAVDTFTVKVADTAKLTINLMMVGDSYATASYMNAHKWLRDLLINAGYTPTVNNTATGGLYLMSELFTVKDDGEFSTGGSVGKFLDAVDNNTVHNDVDYGVFKWDYVLVAVNRRGGLIYTSTYNSELTNIERLEKMLYDHNPDGEIILLATTGSGHADDISKYGSAAAQVTKISANADKIKAALESNEVDIDIKLLRFGEAANVAAADASNMASSSTASYSLLVNNYSDANKRNMGPAGAAMLYNMVAKMMVDIDLDAVAAPSGFKNSSESGNSWSVSDYFVGSIIKYWADVLVDTHVID